MHFLHSSIPPSLPSLPPSSLGSDVTLLGYGSQMQILRQACDMAQSELGVSCELIDLRTILPWDEETVIQVNSIHTLPIQLRALLHVYKTFLAN